ncbi:uncharacterized protein CBL_04954 [Carabus blaptoides fortunei]
MPYLNIILVLSVPDHWCHIPGRENTNYTLEEWKNLTLPKELDTRGRQSVSKCQMYNVSDYTIILNADENLRSYEKVTCQFGWEFDKTWYSETAPSEGEWVCDKELYVSNAFAFGRIGDVIGTFIFGQLGDTIGRSPVFFITLVTLIVGRCLSAFTVHNTALFMFSILLGSLTSTAVFQAPVIIAMEICEESKRAHIAMMQCLGWTAAMCIMPFILWAYGHWFPFILTTTIPCILFLFSSRWMIESPRWLASRGKTSQCIKQLERIAKVNGTTVPSDAMITLRKKTEQTENIYGVMSLFTNWRLAKNTLLLVVCWVVGALVYYVIVLSVNALGGNPFMNFFYQGLAELPANIIGRISSDRIGRRWTQVLAYFIGALACAPIGFFITDPGMEAVTSGLAAFVKFCIAFVFYACVLQTLEIYPTCVRQSGLSLGNITGSAFGILGPYIVHLGTAFDARIPFLICALLCLAGAKHWQMHKYLERNNHSGVYHRNL